MKRLIDIINEGLFDKDIIEKDPIKLDPADLKTRDEVFLYAQVLCAKNKWEFEEIKSGWGENYSRAFEIKYNKQLSLVVDFFNEQEYTYSWKQDDDTFYDINSTEELRHSGDWDFLLNPEIYIWKKSKIINTQKKRERLPRLTRCIVKLKELY